MSKSNETRAAELVARAHAVAKSKGWWDGWPTLCHGCGSYIDPETCGCGSPIEGHTYGNGHGPIPLGCDCYRPEPTLPRPTKDERDYATRVLALLALVTSEVSEAVEEVRLGNFRQRIENGKPEGLPAELADVVIRVFDLAGGLGIDLVHAIETKIAYNATRPVRHGGKLA